MACFLVPTTEAVVTTIIQKKAEKNKKEGKEQGIFLQRIGWLNNMLWGGSALLAFEHVWHGEVTPWFPFLTNAEDPANLTAMLQEMGTVGVGMAVTVTVLWAAMVTAAERMKKKMGKAIPVPVKQDRQMREERKREGGI